MGRYEQAAHAEEQKQKLLQAMETYLLEHKYPPTFRELSEMTGIKSTSSIQYYFDQLILEGRIESDVPERSNKARAFRVTGYDFIKTKK